MKKKEIKAAIEALRVGLHATAGGIAQNDKWIAALKTQAEKQTAAIKKLQANITTHERLDSQAEALATCARRLTALETTK
jgi:hypothetical protein